VIVLSDITVVQLEFTELPQTDYPLFHGNSRLNDVAMHQDEEKLTDVV